MATLQLERLSQVYCHDGIPTVKVAVSQCTVQQYTMEQFSHMSFHNTEFHKAMIKNANSQIAELGVDANAGWSSFICGFFSCVGFGRSRCHLMGADFTDGRTKQNANVHREVEAGCGGVEDVSEEPCADIDTSINEASSNVRA